MPDVLNDIANLPEPARYFPIRNGRYSAGAGLFRFGHAFGNDERDQQLFQFDSCYPRYRENICAVRQLHKQPFYCHTKHSVQTEAAVNHFICQQLARQHPNWFQLYKHHKGYRLDCKLSHEQLEFNFKGKLLAAESDVKPPYQDGFDALASQCQEDIALMSVNDHEQNQLDAIHLCAPNHWCPQVMSGKNMQALHAKVPGFSSANPDVEKLLPAVYKKGPYVRFAWGIQTDEQLNRHPSQISANARVLDVENPQLYLRIERQVLWPIPHCHQLLFTIRTYFLDCAMLSKEENLLLQASLLHMDNDSLAYKGVDREKVLPHLAKLLYAL